MKTKENCENFDDGITQVAPKGEFKAGKEFNLSEKREEMDMQRDYYTTGWYHELDVKKFIRLGKGIIANRNISWEKKLNEFDKLAGDKLVEIEK